MTITYRLTKGSALTHAELDGNFSHFADVLKVVSGKLGLGTSSPSYLLTVQGEQIAHLNAAGDTRGSIGAGLVASGEVVLDAFKSTGAAMILRTASAAGALTERLRVDASGNLGLGTNAPAAKFDLVGPSAVTAFTGTSRLGMAVRGATGTTDYSGIDFIGNAGSTPHARIAAVSKGGGSVLSFGTSNNYTNGITNTALTINEAGKVFVNTAAFVHRTDEQFSVLGNAGFRSDNAGLPALNVRGSPTNGYLAYFYSNGGTDVGNISTNGTTTTYATSSDHRLKSDVQPMTGALAKLAAVRPVTFTWREDGSAGQGFIAHELQAVFPDAVTGSKDAIDDEGRPVYQGVDASVLVAALVSAVQELSARVAALEARG